MGHPAPKSIHLIEATKGSEAQPVPKQHVAARPLTTHYLSGRVACPKPWAAGEVIPRDRQSRSHDTIPSLLPRAFLARHSLSESYRRRRHPAGCNTLLFEDIQVSILEC